MVIHIPATRRTPDIFITGSLRPFHFSIASWIDDGSEFGTNGFYLWYSRKQGFIYGPPKV